MKLRLYFDEDSMDRALVSALRVRGVDIMTARESDLIARPDAEHLGYAANKARALFTYNIADFCDLHAALMHKGGAHWGIVCARQQSLSIGETLRRLLRLIGSVPADEMRNRVEYLSRW